MCRFHRNIACNCVQIDWEAFRRVPRSDHCPTASDTISSTKPSRRGPERVKGRNFSSNINETAYPPAAEVIFASARNGGRGQKPTHEKARERFPLLLLD